MPYINNTASSGIDGAVRGLTAPYTAKVGVLFALISLGGCGLKGPLYLPEESAPVVITPAAQSSSSSSSSESSTTPATP